MREQRSEEIPALAAAELRMDQQEATRAVRGMLQAGMGSGAG